MVISRTITYFVGTQNMNLCDLMIYSKKDMVPTLTRNIKNHPIQKWAFQKIQKVM